MAPTKEPAQWEAPAAPLVSPAWPDEGGLSRDEFVARVCEQGIEHYRDLPWRHIDDAYAVLVSEVMLQQTQVTRVERFWRRFLAAFPTIDALAAASVSDVLELWQGLGYNRRALALKRAADQCAAEHGGMLPRMHDELLALPGVGPATAAGVMAFAYEQPGVYLETNVRAVFINEVFPLREKVPDKEIAVLVAQVCPPAPSREEVSSKGAAPAGVGVLGGVGAAAREVAKWQSGKGAAAHEGAGLCGGESAAHEGAPGWAPDPLSSPRDWYYALLDFGAHLKATGVNPSRKSAHYARQSAFEGSRRQKRAWLVRRVLAADAAGVGLDAAHRELNAAELDAGRDAVEREQFDSIVDDLLAEGFFSREGDVLRAR